MLKEILSIGGVVADAFQFYSTHALLQKAKRTPLCFPAKEPEVDGDSHLLCASAGNKNASVVRQENSPHVPRLIQGRHSTLFLLPLPRVSCQCPFCGAGEKTPVQHMRIFLPVHHLLPLPGG